MFTAAEKLARVHDVLRDAFQGHPSHLVQDDDDPDLWHGDIPGPPEVKVTVLVRPRRSTVDVNAMTADGHHAARLRTYEELCTWAFDTSRVLGIQNWITPRHFVNLVNRVLQPRPPVTYNDHWPHEHEAHLTGDLRLLFRWDAEEARLTAEVWRGMLRLSRTGFRKPTDALGWLAVMRDNLKDTG